MFRKSCIQEAHNQPDGDYRYQFVGRWYGFHCPICGEEFRIEKKFQHDVNLVALVCRVCGWKARSVPLNHQS